MFQSLRSVKMDLRVDTGTLFRDPLLQGFRYCFCFACCFRGGEKIWECSGQKTNLQVYVRANSSLTQMSILPAIVVFPVNYGSVVPETLLQTTAMGVVLGRIVQDGFSRAWRVPVFHVCEEGTVEEVSGNGEKYPCRYRVK
jgi:hypothetical protein